MNLVKQSAADSAFHASLGGRRRAGFRGVYAVRGLKAISLLALRGPPYTTDPTSGTARSRSPDSLFPISSHFQCPSHCKRDAALHSQKPSRDRSGYRLLALQLHAACR